MLFLLHLHIKFSKISVLNFFLGSFRLATTGTSTSLDIGRLGSFTSITEGRFPCILKSTCWALPKIRVGRLFFFYDLFFFFLLFFLVFKSKCGPSIQNNEAFTFVCFNFLSINDFLCSWDEDIDCRVEDSAIVGKDDLFDLLSNLFNCVFKR